MCDYDKYGECSIDDGCTDDDCAYGSTCPIGNNMMCLGKGKCENSNACDDLYYKVRLSVNPLWFVFE